MWVCHRVSCLINHCCDGWYHEFAKGLVLISSFKIPPSCLPGKQRVLIPKIKKTVCHFLTFDMCALIASCCRVFFLMIVSSFNSRFVHLGLFSQTKNRIVVGLPLPYLYPSGNKKGIQTFPRISVQHQFFWSQLKVFLMETFTHSGNLPRPQDSTKPLMMIESTSAPCWKHAESLNSECAARLSQGWGVERSEDVGAGVVH